MTTTPPTEENASDRPSLASLANRATFYRHVGLDTEGRAHFYDADADEILVTATDRRFDGVDRDEHVVETVSIRPDQTVADYVRYVTEEADVDWQERDWGSR